MAETVRERSEIDAQDKWDLSSLYGSDEEWEQAFLSLDIEIEKVAAYAGTLHTASSIHAFLEAETGLGRRLSDLFVYASQRHDEDTRAEAAQSMFSRIYAKYVEAEAKLAFAEPEILEMPEEQLKAVAESPELADYRFTLENILRRKPHTLSGQEEELLASLGEVFGAPKQIANSLQDADLRFEPVRDGSGEEHEVTGSDYILLQSSDDRVLRERSFRSFYKGYRDHIHTFAAAYAGAVKGAAAEAKARHYASSREMSMSGENIPASVYDGLIEAVRRHMPAMYRYEKLRKKLLGLDELHYYDLYAPLVKGSSRKYSFEQAKELVLRAIEPLGKEYGDTVRRAFAERWIDVYPNKGKRGGAYSSGTYDSNPYILMNFTGTLDSVSTIAHEMGHSMHTWRSNHAQPPQYADYTIFVAEVASTVNENLLIEYLLSQTEDPAERLAYLNQYLENFKGTVYRQTMFAEFEREAHAMAERGEALNASSLNRLYGGLIRDYFGEDLVMDDEVSLEWARIPHFYRPFYVYKYATSYSAAVAISEAVLRDGERARDAYLEFLSMGGSRYPLEELAHAGVDLRTAAPVDRALEKFERVLAEAEKNADFLSK